MSSSQVKAVTVYQATDGQNYENIEQARQVSAMHNAKVKLYTIFDKISTAQGVSVNTLTAAFLTNPEMAVKMRDALNASLDYHRRYGKLSPKAKVATAKG
jgi:hypothetical protein